MCKKQKGGIAKVKGSSLENLTTHMLNAMRDDMYFIVSTTLLRCGLEEMRTLVLVGK
jgi:hypothetical protein